MPEVEHDLIDHTGLEGIPAVGLDGVTAADGDLIYGQTLETNWALLAAGASWTQTGTNSWAGGGSTANGAIDGNSATYFRGDTNSVAACAGIVDLGQARPISRCRLIQFSGRHATAFNIDSSDDGTNWTTRYTKASGGAATEVSDFAEVSARYWRIDPTAGGSDTWQVYSFEMLETVSEDGAPVRLAIGTEGQVLTVVDGHPAWVTPA